MIQEVGIKRQTGYVLINTESLLTFKSYTDEEHEAWRSCKSYLIVKHAVADSFKAGGHNHQALDSFGTFLEAGCHNCQQDIVTPLAAALCSCSPCKSYGTAFAVHPHQKELQSAQAHPFAC